MDLFNFSRGKKVISFLTAEAGLGILISYSFLFICSRETLIRITAEDNWYENITALAFILASFIFIYLFINSKRGNDFYRFKTKRNIFFLLLALLFFFGAGEEISWGQRIFGWGTPAEFSRHNLQHETNIHNLDFLESEYYDKNGVMVQRGGLLLKIINQNTLMNVFWIGWTVLVPLLYQVNKKCRLLIDRINIPFGTIQIGALIFISNMLLHVVTRYMPFANDLAVIHPVEVKECNMAFLFFVLALFIYRKEKAIITPPDLNKHAAIPELKVGSYLSASQSNVMQK